jgi:hypothetical protein
MSFEALGGSKPMRVQLGSSPHCVTPAGAARRDASITKAKEG